MFCPVFRALFGINHLNSRSKEDRKIQKKNKKKTLLLKLYTISILDLNSNLSITLVSNCCFFWQINGKMKWIWSGTVEFHNKEIAKTWIFCYCLVSAKTRICVSCYYPNEVWITGRSWTDRDEKAGIDESVEAEFYLIYYVIK